MIRAIGAMILWTVVWCAPGSSQESPQSPINASASKTSVLIAEPFTVRVEVVASTGSRVEFPNLIGKDDSKLGVFDVLATQTLKDIPLDQTPPEISKEGLRRWTQTLTLETLRLGKQSIPSMTAIVTEQGESRTLISEPIEITVNGVLESQEEPLRDISGSIQPDQETPTIGDNEPTWWFGGSMAVAAILAGILGLRWWRKRQHPWVWCRRELQQLEEELHTVGEDFYSCDYLIWMQRLQSVLRTAVSSHRDGKLRFPSTQQLVAEMASIDDTRSMPFCEQMLQELDRVRFGKKPSDLRSESSFSVACEAISEAESLLDHLTTLSRSNRRGV